MKTKTHTLVQVYEAFIACRSSLLGTGSLHNRRNYETRLRRLLELFGGMPVTTIERRHIDEWIAEIAARGLRPATLSGYRRAIKTLFNYAVNEELIERSPARHLRAGSSISDRSKRPPQQAIDAATATAISWLQSDRPRELRDGLAFMMSRSCGPRRGELLALPCRDVAASLERGPDEYGIYRVGSSGKTGETVILFGGLIADAIHRWLPARPPSPSDALFVSTRRPYRRLSWRGMDQGYERVSEAAGLSRPIRSHALRHYVGDETTRRYGAKVASMLLNHSDPGTAATAIAYYHHPDRDDVSMAVAGLMVDNAELAEMRRLFGLS